MAKWVWLGTDSNVSICCQMGSLCVANTTATGTDEFLELDGQPLNVKVQGGVVLCSNGG